jgi:hypothetical protein
MKIFIAQLEYVNGYGQLLTLGIGTFKTLAGAQTGVERHAQENDRNAVVEWYTDPNAPGNYFFDIGCGTYCIFESTFEE